MHHSHDAQRTCEHGVTRLRQLQLHYACVTTPKTLLHTAGRQLSEFGSFAGCPAGQLHELGGGLALLPLKSRHAERCFGLLLYWQGQPLLGWSVGTRVCLLQKGC
jgi:hypothetical protein